MAHYLWNTQYTQTDGLFGQCYSETSDHPPPTVLQEMDDDQVGLLQLELKRLASQVKLLSLNITEMRN